MGKWAALFALGVLCLAAWAFWPQSGDRREPSIGERAGQGAAQPAALSSQVISSEDLPPEGTRSLFDHLIAQNEHLPFPFEKLVALVQAQDPEGRAPVTLLIPQGRSLLKASAHFARPRVLVAADFQAANAGRALGLPARGRLFLGFVEDAAEIEVISYNEAAGRYEFQLVQDYRENGAPHIVYARRAICTTCHQGAAPIFPQRPWSETNANPEVAARIVAARGGEGSYAGVPASVALAVPERFDELTDVANFVPVTQRIWLDGCGEGARGNACRRELLRLAVAFAIDPGGFDGGAATENLRAMQAESWPEGGIAVAEADIRNRDPLAGISSPREWLRKLFAPRPRAGPMDAEQALADFERLPKLPVDLDPVAPRPPRRVLTPAVVDGVFGLAQFFTPADVDMIERAGGFQAQRIDAAIGRIPERFFDPAPFNRVAALKVYLRALGPADLSYCCLDTSEMSPPQALGVPPLALPPRSKLEPFAQYCFACHRGNPARRLDFMSGADEAAVLAGIRSKGEIRDVLDWERYRGTDKEATLMPPADSHQRAALEAALAKDPQLREEMRKVVPALFDF